MATSRHRFTRFGLLAVLVALGPVVGDAPRLGATELPFAPDAVGRELADRGGSSAGAFVANSAAGGFRMASSGSLPDAANDNGPDRDPRGDFLEVGGDYAADGSITFGARVAQFDDPTTSENWRCCTADRNTSIVWWIDVDEDGEVDYFAGAVFNGARVLRANDFSRACEASAQFDPAGRAYYATFPASCIGSPASFLFVASFSYQTPTTSSIDVWPDGGGSVRLVSGSGSVTTTTTTSTTSPTTNTTAPAQTTTTVPPAAPTTTTTRPAPAGNRTPLGALDRAERTPGQVRLVGWAWDPDGSGPTQVQVRLDGTGIAFGEATGSRPDVAQAFPAAGPDRGFDVTVPVNQPGPYRLCVFATDAATSAGRELGCRAVVTAPVGVLDDADPGASSVLVRGWALDPDAASPLVVRVYVDGRHSIDSLADRSRPDVAARWAGYGDRHGFFFNVPLAPGLHRVCLYALDVTIGTQNTTIGCRTVSRRTA